MMGKADTYFLASVALFLLLLLGGLLHGGGGGAAAADILSSVSAEAQVLLSLKIGMGSPDVLSDWKFEECSGNSSWGRQSHCRWRGVQCDGFHRVVGLNMSHMKLHGTVSSEIGKLGNLNNLTFACNALTGPLPVEISNLESLRSLNVSSNNFSGSFPSNISELKELRVLDAYNNNFTGPLPVELSRLRKLEHVDLGGNYFSGKIPSEYSRIQSLRYLALKGNELIGRIPREFGNLVNLKELYIGYYNSYEGGIPSEFGKLTNLVRLDMANCGLSGTIPPELGQLRSLDSLFLQVNSLWGNIPAELANLSNLMSLDLSDNELTGEIPAEFRRLQKLKLLSLFKNKLHGTIPTFIADLPNFEVLGLWENNFTGEIPHNLGRNGKLLQLDLSCNRLTGFLPPYLCKSNKLQILIMLDNFFFGPIPEILGKCKSLKRVRMSRNFFNGSIPNGFLDLPFVELIELNDNYLTGVIPTSISVTRKLKQIILSNNRLSGPIPPAIGNLPSLQQLLLAGNQLTGSLPREIGRLKHLSKIDFSNNKLSGQIPPEISQCVSLIFVDLSRNDLGGTIPPEIAKVRSLNYLNISRNHLVGNIPEQIGGMSLTSVDLSFNNLSGVVPASGLFKIFNATTFVGNPGLCLSYLNPACIQTTKSYGGRGTGTNRGQLSSFIAKLFLVIGLVFCCSAVAIGGICKARIEWKRNSSRRWRLTAFQRLHFSCEDVLGSLKEENIIGRGGSGTVYRGLMSNGQQVAVKRLPAIGMGKGSSHDDHGFSAEIRTLGKIRHRHIVKLLGFCSNQEINLLVYEYMANGSLGDMLHGRKGGHLHWDSRYRIALEAAKGLCYLHHDCSPIIIHRDVKSNNILLGSNFEAHVADFGLAKFLQDSAASQSMSSVAGSYGYIAPEYAYTLRVDEKSDVYSFGVVLLELITGRKPLGEFGEGVDIVQWVRKTTECVQERVSEVIDTRLSTVPLQEVMHLFFIAMLCVQEQSIKRPTMREVVHMLTLVPNYNSKCQTTV